MTEAHEQAGWHPDPWRRFQQRYWSGSHWTEHVANGSIVGVDERPLDLAELPQPVQRRPVPRWFWLLVVFIFVGIVAVAAIGSDDEPTADDAVFICQEFVADRLKAPSTADFATPRQSVVRRSGNAFIVNSYVDAENSFGANVRTRYSCMVQPTDDGDWRLQNLNID